MGRQARRKTSWEPAAVTVRILGIDDPVGIELLDSAGVSEWAPGTLVRIRGPIIVTSVTSVSSSMPGVVVVCIRKVRLARTDDAYVVPSASITEGPYLAQEDILFIGAIKLTAVSDSTTANQRASGFIDVDIKAKRKFDSGEERLVMDVESVDGASQDLDVHALLRCLILAG